MLKHLWQFRSVLLVSFLLSYTIWHIFYGSKIGSGSQPIEQNTSSTHIRFVDATEKLGANIEYTNLKSRIPEFVDAGIIFNKPSTLAIEDLNHDSYMDIVLVNESYPYLQILTYDPSSKRYKREKLIEKTIFEKVKASHGRLPTGLLITDIDNNNEFDLLLSFYEKCPVLIKNFFQLSVGGPYEPISIGDCPKGTTLSEADVNLDGKNDYVFGAYSSPEADVERSNQKLNMKTIGGKSTLLINQGDLNFTTHPFPYKTFVNSIGFTYLKDSPSLAIFRGNDYATDEMYLFKNNQFINITHKTIPVVNHGYAGMNSDFFDINKDGLIDLYVSNIYAPPYQRRGNLLWIRKNNDTFYDATDEYGVQKCGYSWAAKFASFDNSGNNQLVVVNGVWENDETRDKKVEYWNIRSLVRMLPVFLTTSSKVKREDLYFSGNNYWCLFDFSKKPAVNIAEAAGVHINSPTRALALIDIDNSGKMSFITADINGKLSIFKNETISSGNWVGVHITPSSKAIGVRLSFESLDPIIVRENFPTHGYGAQSDPRIHIGLGNLNPTSIKLKVTLSTGKSQLFTLNKINEYNIIDVSNL